MEKCHVNLLQNLKVMALATNLLVVDGIPFVPDVVESHPGADDIG
jgi:hypothetical protein